MGPRSSSRPVRCTRGVSPSVRARRSRNPCSSPLAADSPRRADSSRRADSQSCRPQRCHSMPESPSLRAPIPLRPGLRWPADLRRPVQPLPHLHRPLQVPRRPRRRRQPGTCRQHRLARGQRCHSRLLRPSRPVPSRTTSQPTTACEDRRGSWQLLGGDCDARGHSLPQARAHGERSRRSALQLTASGSARYGPALIVPGQLGDVQVRGPVAE